MKSLMVKKKKRIPDPRNDKKKKENPLQEHKTLLGLK